jgi:UDP-3-O-[3-hydroxymyristoyl] N-acetylglucosamine deacetylase
VTRRTLANEVSIDGVALHAGRIVRMTLAPASAGSGVVFRRSDLGGAEIAARYDRVAETRLGTVIAEGDIRVGVVEHLMAAIAGAEIDDLVVTLDGPEPPILDGDARSYLALIEQAEFREQAGERKAVCVRRRVEVKHQDAYAALEPSDRLEFDFEITFAAKAIGTQQFEWAFSADGFRNDIAPARTFGFLHELEALNKAGLARGASPENTLAIDGEKVLNANLLRFADEFVRHKILDALGDLALAGAPVVGRFVGRKSGHALNNALLRALFAESDNFQMVTLSTGDRGPGGATL